MKSYYIFFLSCLSLLFASCKTHQEEKPSDAPVISDSMLRTLPTAVAVEQDATGVIKLNGKIQADESKLVKVFALVSGKILKVNAELGDYVHKGQLLAVIKSTEVAGTSNDLSLAQSDVALARKTLQTTKDLYDGKLATEQDYINAKIAYNKALSALNKARQVQSITGGSQSTYYLTAPISGYIIEKNITANSAVRPDNSAELFSVADLSKVWIMANVYEADMTNIHLGDAVKVNTLARPDKDYTGVIDKIYNVLDPTTRTMKVRISMNNPGNELKPEMFATVTVEGKSNARTLSIPAHALVLDNSKNYVIVKNGPKLNVHEVNLIKRIDSIAFISGISAGDTVVTNSELFLYQALTSK